MQIGDVKLPAGFGLTVQPMLHVDDMGATIALFEAIGARVLFGSRDGDWALLAFGDSRLSLLAHPPGDDPAQIVELQFASSHPLEALESYLMDHYPDRVERWLTDEAFGRMLRLRTPDGTLIKVIEVERHLID
ncbi:hypothetical protein ACLB0R_03155 [Sphingomonas sp. GlSt437]|uniref:hypothetical protein n=1 Tax=Sphingomonas sp. GlSt437 TaxID=3389970 RepID=UPI003A857CB6